MAVQNIEMNIMNSSNSYDTLYPKTDYSNVLNTPTIPTASTFQGTYDNRYLLKSGGTVSGNLTLKGSGNYGTSINFGDGDYVHISEPTDDCMEVKAKKVNFVLSDTSSSQFTINDVNPFGGGNSDLADNLKYYKSTYSISTSSTIVFSQMMFMGYNMIFIYFWAKTGNITLGNNNYKLNYGDSGTFFTLHDSGVQFILLSPTWSSANKVQADASGSIKATLTNGSSGELVMITFGVKVTS